MYTFVLVPFEANDILLIIIVHMFYSFPAAIAVNGVIVDEAKATPLTNGILYGIDTILGSPEDLVGYLRRMQEKKH